MNKLAGIVLIVIVFIACKNLRKGKAETAVKAEFIQVIKDNYELTKPMVNLKKVLVLFGGFSEKPADIEHEFNILPIAKENGIAVVYMNYSKNLWLEANEKQQLAEQLQNIFLENKLPTTDIYLGGFSSGGNMALLIGDYLNEKINFKLAPKGVFIIDSPIDLVALYRSAEKNVANKFSAVAVQESTWIIETLGKRFGNPSDNISKYEDYAVYTSQTNNIDNLQYLKNTKIRFYTEPDTLWWKVNRKAEYDQMNAFYIKRLYESLKDAGFNQVAYMPTANKGYRANGDRHPHSWSIVDKPELMKWIME